MSGFVNITSQTFYNYTKEAGYETYFDICARIKDIIDGQHFEGGMTGAFDAGIVARKLGLPEKQNIDQRNINYNATITKVEAKEISDALENEY